MSVCQNTGVQLLLFIHTSLKIYSCLSKDGDKILIINSYLTPDYYLFVKTRGCHPLFTQNRTIGSRRSWHGRPVRATNQIKCLLNGCDDWNVSADLPEWDSHNSIIKETTLKPDIVIHSASTQQLIMVELTVPNENRMAEAHEKYLNLTKELENADYKAVVMPVEVGARGFVGSSVYDLLTKLSII